MIWLSIEHLLSRFGQLPNQIVTIGQIKPSGLTFSVFLNLLIRFNNLEFDVALKNKYLPFLRKNI